MSEPIQFDFDGEDGQKIRRVLRAMTGPALEQVYHVFANYKISRMVRSFPRMSSETGSTPGGPPAVRSGQLRASLTYRILGRALEVGTNLVYAAILHFGGIIRPKTKKALTVPISPAARGKRAADFSDTFILPPREGDPDSRGIIARRIGKDEIEPLFALRAKVELPPRPWLYWDARDRAKLLTILEQNWSAQS